MPTEAHNEAARKIQRFLRQVCTRLSREDLDSFAGLARIPYGSWSLIVLSSEVVQRHAAVNMARQSSIDDKLDVLTCARCPLDR